MKKNTFSHGFLAHDFRRLFVNGFGPENTGGVLRTIEYRLERNLTGTSYRAMCNDGTLRQLRHLRNWFLHLVKMHRDDGCVPCIVYSTFADNSGFRAFGTAVIPMRIWEDSQYAGMNPNNLKPDRILPSKPVYCRVPRDDEQMQRMADALDEIVDLIVEIGEAKQQKEREEEA
jgi:hypothetical protein